MAFFIVISFFQVFRFQVSDFRHQVIGLKLGCQEAWKLIFSIRFGLHAFQLPSLQAF
jgi:hypothetical protein